MYFGCILGACWVVEPDGYLASCCTIFVVHPSDRSVDGDGSGMAPDHVGGSFVAVSAHGLGCVGFSSSLGLGGSSGACSCHGRDYG